MKPSDADDDLDGSLVAVRTDDPLRAWNRAGVLAPVDVHTAHRLSHLAAETDPQVILAVALAVRAPRAGQVSVDLATVRNVAGADLADDVEVDRLPWPSPTGWVERVAASPLVAVGDAGDSDRPLRLIGTAVYLDRYWRDEVAVGRDLLARSRLLTAGPPDTGTPDTGPPDTAPPDTGSAATDPVAAVPGGLDPHQVRAVHIAAARHVSVIAGGPGTGKTTTVAGLLALLLERAASSGARPPMVGLAAPTGKAAARLEEAVRNTAAAMLADGGISREVFGRLSTLAGSTVHRLLGARRGTAQFRHHRGLRLPHDVIVVDEASMISLTLMARLLEAVRPDARLVLVGDPEQLVSVEAGAVLADIVGPAAVSGEPAGSARSPLAGCVSFLRTNHRFGGPLVALATAVREGREDAVLSLLSSEDATVTWVADATTETIAGALTAWAASLVSSARDGDAPGALATLAGHRILCAHRQGPDGASAWNEQVGRWLAPVRPVATGEGTWFAGRPVLVTANDYSLGLYNGDTGVAVADPDGGVSVAFDAGTPRTVRPARLADVETAYAMTVHKSQGSEFDQVTLVLPPSTSRLLTRELLYTAVTRARHRLVVVGSEEAIRVAVRRRIVRASGLGARMSADAEVDATGIPEG